MRKNKQWSSLDNAAKIFAPTSSKRDTKVFRFACELTEPVDGDVLQHALDKTVKAFPHYLYTIKKGLFWYYFEESSIAPKVCEERIPVCSPIYSIDRHSLLFRVSFFRRRINLEVFHALADGSGAMQFLRTMTLNYLAEKHGVHSSLDDYNASRDQKNLDAFYKYYDKEKYIPKIKHTRAYRIKGQRLPDNRLGVIEGFMSVGAVLEKAHKCGASLSEFLITVLLCSIFDGMAVRERSRPVVITVPVDLRRFFPSQTARNFFGVITVPHSFLKDGQEFNQVIGHVKSAFKRQLTKENRGAIINRYSSLENNPLAKIVPLQAKIAVLRMAGLLAGRQDTSAFSNIGRIAMPAEASKYIRLFDVFVSTRRPQLCLCSFGDTLSVSISSPLADTGLQMRFFRRLTGMGLSVKIASNLEQIIGEDGKNA